MPAIIVSMRFQAWWPGVSLATLLVCSEGSAYCRTTTVEATVSSCPEPCETGGRPLYWPMRALSYTLNEEGFPNLSDSELRSILSRSFGAWEQVQCDGQPVGLTIRQEAETTSLLSGPREEEPNQNVIAYVPPESWTGDRHAFAITKIWFRGTSGNIVGADMLFNGNMDPFGVCPSAGCPRDELTDLANVVTHEAGHFLGLAHSNIEGSTMWCDAAPGDTDKRSLETDDMEGLCAIYGADVYPAPEPPLTTSFNGCALSPLGRESSEIWGLFASTIAFWVGYRRRFCRRHRPA